VQQLRHELKAVLKERESATSELLQLKGELRAVRGGTATNMGATENLKANSAVTGAGFEEEGRKLRLRIEELEIELAATETLHKQVRGVLRPWCVSGNLI
jgi:hypothetical protein